MVFSGGSLSKGSEWSPPSDHPVRGERDGMVLYGCPTRG